MTVEINNELMNNLMSYDFNHCISMLEGCRWRYIYLFIFCVIISHHYNLNVWYLEQKLRFSGQDNKQTFWGRRFARKFQNEHWNIPIDMFQVEWFSQTILKCCTSNRRELRKKLLLLYINWHHAKSIEWLPVYFCVHKSSGHNWC